MSTLGNKKVELFDMGAGVSGEPTAEDNVQVASCESLLMLLNLVTTYIFAGLVKSWSLCHFYE